MQLNPTQCAPGSKGLTADLMLSLIIQTELRGHFTCSRIISGGLSGSILTFNEQQSDTWVVQFVFLVGLPRDDNVHTTWLTATGCLFAVLGCNPTHVMQQAGKQRRQSR